MAEISEILAEVSHPRIILGRPFTSNVCVCIYQWRLFVGIMMGITNTLATLPGIIGPAVVGVITHRNVSAIPTFRHV